MQVHSIISNTISEELLQTGHLSIRFLADGFSLLLADRNFKPVILNRFTDDSSRTRKGMIGFCEEWLNRHTLLNDFKGEITIVLNASAATIVPEDLFTPDAARSYLQNTASVSTGSAVRYKKMKMRPVYLVYEVHDIIQSLPEKFNGTARIMHPDEILISLADQVNASDHQRGFVLTEYQEGSLHCLIISDDNIRLSNQLKVKNEEEIVYFTLNFYKQLEIERRSIPLYLTGLPDEKVVSSLKKYIRKVQSLSYYIQDIDKGMIPEHAVLAEATKCE